MMNESLPPPRDQIPRLPKLPVDASLQLSYGFTEDDLVPDPAALDSAPTLDLWVLLDEIRSPKYCQYDPDAGYRTLNMALALFTKLCDDSAYDGITYNDIFAVCLDTALIWEVG